VSVGLDLTAQSALIFREDAEQMRTLAEQAAEELADASAEEIIRWATDTFGDRICITSSMTDAVIIHLASAVKPGIDVVFLDTGYHFAETVGTRDAVDLVYPVRMLNITPSRTVAEQDAELGPRLYGRNPDLCCYLRKVEPLERALTNYDAWITGVRSDETNSGHARGGVGRPAGDGQGQPDHRVDEQAGRRVHRREQRAGEPARVRRLPVDRVLHLHGASRAGCRPAQRPVEGHRQDRVRDPCLNWHSLRC
jgi:hypothetical protein